VNGFIVALAITGGAALATTAVWLVVLIYGLWHDSLVQDAVIEVRKDLKSKGLLEEDYYGTYRKPAVHHSGPTYTDIVAIQDRLNDLEAKSAKKGDKK
jgi:hypothetical protein